MPRRKHRTAAPLPLSIGPLPRKLEASFLDWPLAFCDASQLTHGGLGVVLFEHGLDPVWTARRSLPPLASNELELHAACFALEVASQFFAGRRFALFSDNQDAIAQLLRWQGPGDAGAPPQLAAPLQLASLHWIKGHGRCRGNALADAAAREAAQGGFSR